MTIAYAFKERIRHNRTDKWIVGIIQIQSHHPHRYGGRNEGACNLSLKGPVLFHSYCRDKNKRQLPQFAGKQEWWWHSLDSTQRMSDYVKTKEEANRIVNEIVTTQQTLRVLYYPENSQGNLVEDVNINFFPQKQRPTLQHVKYPYYNRGGGRTEGHSMCVTFNGNIFKHLLKRLNLPTQGPLIRLYTGTFGHISKSKRITNYFNRYIESAHKCVHSIKNFMPMAKYKLVRDN